MGRSGRAGALLNPAFGTLLVYLYFCRIFLFFFFLPKIGVRLHPSRFARPPFQSKAPPAVTSILAKTHLEGCGNLFGWVGKGGGGVLGMRKL